MNTSFVVAAVGLVGTLFAGMLRIPTGDYLPLRGMGGGVRTHVPAFLIDAHEVTRGEFLGFVQVHPEWRRGNVSAKLAESAYLAEWPGALDPGDATDTTRPVTSVSWYAATAYCEAEHARLPSIDEWEYAAQASESLRDASRDRVFIGRLLAMYASASTANRSPVGHGFRNVYGLEGMHGSAREWTRDFKPQEMQSCAGAAMGASDAANYPALLREAFRSALTARSTVRMLGFRCAASAP